MVIDRRIILGGIGTVVVLAGLGTGWLLSNRSPKATTTPPKVASSSKEAGVNDESKYPDTAEGMLVAGGIEGEGQFHLERSGGASQNVYLTSTVIDLSTFEGKKVKVWGQTLSAKKAGWLMDVGRVRQID